MRQRADSGVVIRGPALILLAGISFFLGGVCVLLLSTPNGAAVRPAAWVSTGPGALVPADHGGTDRPLAPAIAPCGNRIPVASDPAAIVNDATGKEALERASGSTTVPAGLPNPDAPNGTRPGPARGSRSRVPLGPLAAVAIMVLGGVAAAYCALPLALRDVRLPRPPDGKAR
jgi:hypothetical protein